AAVGLGYYPDFPSAIKGMTRIKDCFEPIASNQSLYHDLHQRVYRKLYARLEPIFREIKSVMDEHEGRERPQ
ncbi:MAG: hypothetical protein HY899_01910, partial [Deltaproteobacteria bacterium]|nr:hypothetical protein [Deltaproteobacteria bacterium]